MIFVLNFVFCVKLIFKEQIIVKVNDENKGIIYDALEGKVQDVKLIKMVGLGNGFSSGDVEVFYSLGKREQLKIYEGMDFGELEPYIREHGLSLDDVAQWMAGSISIITIIGMIACAKNKFGVLTNKK
jgi:hypothetical protein